MQGPKIRNDWEDHFGIEENELDTFNRVTNISIRYQVRHESS